MKIQICEAGGTPFTIPLPGFLISPAMIRFALKIGRKYAGNSIPDLPEETMDVLCNALNTIKKRYGTWELVLVQSADGDEVRILL